MCVPWENERESEWNNNIHYKETIERLITFTFFSSSSSFLFFGWRYPEITLNTRKWIRNRGSRVNSWNTTIKRQDSSGSDSVANTRSAREFCCGWGQRGGRMVEMVTGPFLWSFVGKSLYVAIPLCCLSRRWYCVGAKKESEKKKG